MNKFKLIDARWKDISYGFSELNMECNPIDPVDQNSGFKDHITARMDIYRLLFTCPCCHKIEKHIPGCRYE